MQSPRHRSSEPKPHAERYFQQAQEIAGQIDYSAVENLAQELVDLRERAGRLFLLGVGGSAANCSHTVNDFRKLDPRSSTVETFTIRRSSPTWASNTDELDVR